MIIDLKSALNYLQNEQNQFEFSSNFLADPAVKAAVLQGLLDAQGALLQDVQQLVFQYNLDLSRADYDKPNTNLPFYTHMRNAQVLIYERTLSSKS